MCEDVKHRISHTSSILTVDKGITAFVLASQYIYWDSKLLAPVACFAELV